MAELIGKAWLRAATPANVVSGFQVAGIWPLDRTIFSNEQYLPSSVTDRPLNAEPTLSLQNSPALNAASSSQMPSASSVTSNAAVGFLSPQQFRGYPKVHIKCRPIQQLL